MSALVERIIAARDGLKRVPDERVILALEAMADAANAIVTLEAALKSIAADTDPENPDSYRCDDREGCLDAVQALACDAIAKAGGEA